MHDGQQAAVQARSRCCCCCGMAADNTSASSISMSAKGRRPLLETSLLGTLLSQIRTWLSRSLSDEDEPERS